MGSCNILILKNVNVLLIMSYDNLGFDFFKILLAACTNINIERDFPCNMSVHFGTDVWFRATDA